MFLSFVAICVSKQAVQASLTDGELLHKQTKQIHGRISSDLDPDLAKGAALPPTSKRITTKVLLYDGTKEGEERKKKASE
jgi:hypothetical protein